MGANMIQISGGVTHPHGFRASGVASGIKRSLRPDLALLFTDRPAAAAGIFTTNRVRAAPVEMCAERLSHDPGRIHGAVVVSGVANALTGPAGRADQEEVTRAAAELLGVPPESLLPAATGVIGPRIPVEKVRRALPEAVRQLASDREGSSHAAHAILTTDTGPKEAATTVRLADGTRVRVGGMAKGSGMIAPAMGPLHATTLGFVTTDARVTPAGLERLLTREGDRTFNMICVDGDTSTNDTLLAFSNGAAGGPVADDDPALGTAVGQILESLARAVAKDGEGATKLLTIRVRGASDSEHARRAAKAVARSTLVKTALFGADPNVGRIACALGYSGADFAVEHLNVSLVEGARNLPLIVGGIPAPGLDNGGGQRIHAVLQRQQEVTLDVDLGAGPAAAVAWGCDLSYGYVHINAAYRT